MSDMEARLRAMLGERADDIAVLPSGLLDDPGRDAEHEFELAGPHPGPEVVGLDARPPRGRGTRWLVAASAAAVAAVGATVVGLSGGHGDGPVDPGRPSGTSTSSTPVPDPSLPPEPARTRSSLLHFDADFSAPNGWVLRSRTALAGRQSFGVQLRSDPANRSHVSDSTAFVGYYETGRFDPSTVTDSVTVRVGARAAILGVARPAPGQFLRTSTRTVPTLAWRVGDRWAVAQAGTHATGTRSAMLTLARGLHPDVRQTFTLPLRMTAVPADYRAESGTIYEVDDLGRFAYLTNNPKSGDSTDLSVSVDSTRTDKTYRKAGAKITVDGHTGTIWSPGTASFRVGTRVILVNMGGPAYTRSAFRNVLEGIRWCPDPGDQSTWFDGTTLLR